MVWNRAYAASWLEHQMINNHCLLPPSVFKQRSAHTNLARCALEIVCAEASQPKLLLD